MSPPSQILRPLFGVHIYVVSSRLPMDIDERDAAERWDATPTGGGSRSRSAISPLCTNTAVNLASLSPLLISVTWIEPMHQLHSTATMPPMRQIPICLIFFCSPRNLDLPLFICASAFRLEITTLA